MGNSNGHPVTRRELREELTRFATKKDLTRFATKKDLTRFATKKDLADALRNYPTKADLQDALQPHALAIVELQSRVGRIEERMATKDDIGRIMETLDHLLTVNTQAWNKLTVHDERLHALEERCPPVG